MEHTFTVEITVETPLDDREHVIREVIKATKGLISEIPKPESWEMAETEITNIIPFAEIS